MKSCQIPIFARLFLRWQSSLKAHIVVQKVEKTIIYDYLCCDEYC